MFVFAGALRVKRPGDDRVDAHGFIGDRAVEPMAQQLGFAGAARGDKFDDGALLAEPSVVEQLQLVLTTEEFAFDGGQAVAEDGGGGGGGHLINADFDFSG